MALEVAQPAIDRFKLAVHLRFVCESERDRSLLGLRYWTPAARGRLTLRYRWINHPSRPPLLAKLFLKRIGSADRAKPSCKCFVMTTGNLYFKPAFLVLRDRDLDHRPHSLCLEAPIVRPMELEVSQQTPR